MSGIQSKGALAGVRVVDFTNMRAELAGRMLADMGAEVLKIEPPGGAEARACPPFESGRENDPDGSLYWAAVGRGKVSKTLDIGQESDRAQLKTLLSDADIFIESFDPGYLVELGLDYEQIKVLNPGLVYVSVTPYGQTGPAANDPSTQLTLEAAGGLLGLQGDGDRPPVPISYPQPAFHAGAQAAVDAVIALNERENSGLGQHLDVSTQACVVWCLMNGTGFPPNEGRDIPGTGLERAMPEPTRIPGLDAPPIVKCADGYVTNMMGAVGPTARALAEVVLWCIEDQGALPEHIPAIEWSNWVPVWKSGELSTALLNEAVQLALEFLTTKTKQEIAARATSHGLLNVPVASTEDLLADIQLKARGYWVDINARTHPGAFAQMSRNKVGSDAPAPLFNGSGDDVKSFQWSKPSSNKSIAGKSGDSRGQAFAGLKVADFAWVGVGPIVSKFLADHGATVVRIESANRPDVLRRSPPFKGRKSDYNNSQFMANFNSSKLSLALDMSGSEGRDIASRMVEWADVAVESFTPGTMEKFGLGWEEVSKSHPELIMVSTCLRGQTGPDRSLGGFGNQGAALAGLHAITGWPDRIPAGPYGAYTDFIAPRFGAFSLTSALYERRKSGLGQHIDLSQVEAGIQFIEPLILDYTVNGRVALAAGHDSLSECPHGVYASAGIERYVAISVNDSTQWRALAQEAGLSQFADDKFDQFEQRLAARAEIDRGLREFCEDKSPFILAARLRELGVPASVVLRPSDLYEDSQLLHRKFFVTLEHSKMGPTPYDGPATLYSETPPILRKAAPQIGEDTDYVLSEILGLGAPEISALKQANVFV
ncbi:MAG: CoA transferase [Pseudomonadales bacterium]|nr:CoA transferase [Pseudomonadales bacterium]